MDVWQIPIWITCPYSQREFYLMISTAHCLYTDDRVCSLKQQGKTADRTVVSDKHYTCTGLLCQMSIFTCNLKLAVILSLRMQKLNKCITIRLYRPMEIMSFWYTEVNYSYLKIFIWYLLLLKK